MKPRMHFSVHCVAIVLPQVVKVHLSDRPNERRIEELPRSITASSRRFSCALLSPCGA